MEQLFSRSGHLADPNMDPNYLATLTTIGINKKVYKPSVSEIKDMYYQMYRGQGAAGAERGFSAAERLLSAAGPSTPGPSSIVRSSEPDDSP